MASELRRRAGKFKRFEDYEPMVDDAIRTARFIVRSKAKELEALDKLISEIHESDEVDEKTKNTLMAPHQEQVFKIAQEFITIYETSLEQISKEYSVIHQKVYPSRVRMQQPIRWDQVGQVGYTEGAFESLQTMMSEGWLAISTFFEQFITVLAALGGVFIGLLPRILTVEDSSFVIDFRGLNAIMDEVHRSNPMGFASVAIAVSTALLTSAIFDKLKTTLNNMLFYGYGDLARLEAVKERLQEDYEELLSVISEIAGSRTCPICYVDYDDTHKKKFLQCGHSSCETALQKDAQRQIRLGHRPKCAVCSQPYESILSAPPSSKLKYSGYRK